MTKKRTQRLRYLLLDADIIIKLHEYGVWSKAVSLLDIYVPSIVAKEVLYFNSESGSQIDIDLFQQSEKGHIEIVECKLQDIIQFEQQYLSPELDDGENEAIALLWAGYLDESVKFCTADKAAIIVACLLDLGDRIISLEHILKQLGIDRPLYSTCRTDTVTAWIRRGKARRIQGDGLPD